LSAIFLRTLFWQRKTLDKKNAAITNRSISTQTHRHTSKMFWAFQLHFSPLPFPLIELNFCCTGVVVIVVVASGKFSDIYSLASCCRLSVVFLLLFPRFVHTFGTGRWAVFLLSRLDLHFLCQFPGKTGKPSANQPHAAKNAKRNNKNKTEAE